MSDMNELIEAEVQKKLIDPVYLREAILHLTDIIAGKDREIETLTPIKDFYDRITASDNWMEMAAAVKVLAYKGFGRNKTFEMLRERKILRSNNEPYQDYVERGYFKTIEEEFDDTYGRAMIYRKTMVSQKGLDFIRKLIEAEVAA